MDPLQRITAPTLDVLSVLLARPEPTWGLLIIKETKRPAGTIYPILDRLEQRGWLTSQWEDEPHRPGPRRRLYTLTADGAVAARSALATRPRPVIRSRPAHGSARAALPVAGGWPIRPARAAAAAGRPLSWCQTGPLA